MFSQSWRNRNYGLVLQDEMSYNDWTWLFGIRYGYIKQNYRLNELLPLVINNKQEQSDNSVMPRVGVNWRATSNLALYANYSAGNMPTLPQRRSVNGNSFDPISSKQLEVGLKLQGLNNKWLSTLAAFDIELNNGLTRDPVNTSFSLQTGKQRSKGIEWAIQGELANNWQLVSQMTFLDTYIEKDTRYAKDNRLPYNARFGASAWLTHQVYLDNACKLSLSGGVVHQGKKFADFANTTVLPSFTRFDFGANYSAKNWSANISVENLFNKKYYASGVENRPAVIYPGAPRTAVLSLNYFFK